MTRTPYESPAFPMSNNATDPVFAAPNQNCRTKLILEPLFCRTKRAVLNTSVRFGLILFACLNLVASGVFAWANLNAMALNTSKTKSILITTQQKFHRLNDHSLDVMINGKLIEQVQDAKLLGVSLDRDYHLTWEKHIENICSIIVNSRLSLLKRIKPFLNHHCALRFFNSCIHNLFIYCSGAWGNCSNYLLSRLFLLQKRAARLLLDADFSQPSVGLFSKLK